MVNYYTLQYEYDPPSAKKTEKRTIRLQAKTVVEAINLARKRCGKHAHNFKVMEWSPATYSHERRFAD